MAKQVQQAQKVPKVYPASLVLLVMWVETAWMVKQAQLVTPELWAEPAPQETLVRQDEPVVQVQRVYKANEEMTEELVRPETLA